MALIQIIVPEDLVNYVKNPSAEGSAGFAAYGGATSVTVVTGGRYGRKRYQVVTTGAGQGVELDLDTVTSGTAYASAWVSVAPTGGVAISANQGSWAASATLSETDGVWKRYSATAAPGVAPTKMRITQVGAGSFTWYVDGGMYTRTSYLVPYFDGDSLVYGGDGVGFGWSLQAHASASICYGRLRGTGKPNVGYGRIIDLDDIAGLVLSAAQGIGAPPIEHVNERNPARPGLIYQTSQLNERAVVLTLHVVGASLGDLHAKRKAIMDYVQLGEPFRLRYTGATLADGNQRVLELDCLYAGNLDFSQVRGFSETINLQLTAPDPRPRHSVETAYPLANLSTSIAGDYVFKRVDGVWSGSGSVGAETRHVVPAPNGRIFAVCTGGAILEWNGAGWSSIGTAAGGGGPNIYAACMSTDGGRLYIGGRFATVSGVAAANVAYYDLTAGTWNALGGGCNNVVTSMCATLDGAYIVASGVFTSPGASVARWNIAATAWETMATGATGGPGYALLPLPNGDVAMGGDFTSAGTLATPGAPTDALAAGGSLPSTSYKYKVVARAGRGVTAASAASAGKTTLAPNFTVNVSWPAVTGATSYDLYRQDGGAGNYVFLVNATSTNYIDTGSVAVNTSLTAPATATDGSRTPRVARWSKVDAAWYGVGVSGFNNTVWGMALAPNGQTLYATGDFTTCDGATCGRAAVLIGTQWLPMGATGLNSTGYNVRQGPDGLVYFVGAFTAAEGKSSRAYIAAWTGYDSGQWVGVDIQPAGTLFNLAWRGRDLWLCALAGAFAATAAAANMIVYGGAVEGRPRLDIVGPATLHMLNLWPADWTLYGAPLVVAAGEEVSVHFEAPAGPAVISKTRGAIETGTFEGPSDRGAFRLQRGTQTARLLVTGATAATVMEFRERLPFSSFDYGVG